MLGPRVLFDHLIRTGDQRRRHGEAECPRSFEVDHQFELGGLNDRQLGRLFALEDSADIDAGLAIGLFALAVEMPFDLAPMDVAIFSGKNFRKPGRFGTKLWCSAEGYSLVGVDGTS